MIPTLDSKCTPEKTGKDREVSHEPIKKRLSGPFFSLLGVNVSVRALRDSHETAVTRTSISVSHLENVVTHTSFLTGNAPV